MEEDFPENMDDFVTLDELADEDDMDSQSKGDSSAGTQHSLLSFKCASYQSTSQSHLTVNIITLSFTFQEAQEKIR